MKRSEIQRASALPRNRKPAKKRKKTANIKAKARATVLHSQYVRARDGSCVRCTRNGTVPSSQLQCAHIVSRRYAATRTKEWNACALCSACHRRLTEHPDEAYAFNLWWCATYGEYSYEKVRQLAYEGKDSIMRGQFWQDEIERLNGLLEAL